MGHIKAGSGVDGNFFAICNCFLLADFWRFAYWVGHMEIVWKTMKRTASSNNAKSYWGFMSAILWFVATTIRFFASCYCFIVAWSRKYAHVVDRPQREWNKKNWILLSRSFWGGLILFFLSFAKSLLRPCQKHALCILWCGASRSYWGRVHALYMLCVHCNCASGSYWGRVSGSCRPLSAHKGGAKGVQKAWQGVYHKI